ncbi:MAG TPA: inositol monophosphatase family protein [Candidatus Binatia bacterium]|nr:inositol monophosphatase family protein [Candidatus Binatia bacterium]
MTIAAGSGATATEGVTSWAADRAFAVDTAHRAGLVLLDRYERLERIHHKSAKDVVTEADHLSEELIISAIRAHAPGDGILAEESGSHAVAGGVAATAGKGRVWVVDPLDGTVNYANGIPFFCVSISLVVDGRPVVGVIRDPARDETFAADALGEAVLIDREAPTGRRIQASDKEKLSDFVVALALAGRAVATRVRTVRKAVRVSRNMGAAALELAYVGNGRFDALLQSAGLSAWDIAAAGLIAERAGATVTDASGGPWFDLSRAGNVNGIVAAPPRLHGELLALSR